MDNLREKITQELYDFNVHADITVEDLADVMYDVMFKAMKDISGREYVKRFGTCPMCTDCPDGCPLDN